MQIGRKRSAQIIRLIKAHLLAFAQVLDTSGFEHPAMNENVFPARFRTNEAITSGTMKHLNDAGWHAHSFSKDPSGHEKEIIDIGQSGFPRLHFGMPELID